MARHARRESSTQFYHVMMRGINREFLFRRDRDKEEFMSLIKAEQEEGRLALAAWCLMDNHVHLLVKADLKELSKAVKIVSIKYASYYNYHTDRVGPVFGDRYRSESVEDDRYLLGVLRYIHLNPVKAKMVARVADYPWSSYGEYTGTSRLIDEDQRASIVSQIGSINSFADFHRQEDDTLYLEISEDAEAYKEELAGRLLENFCREHDIASPSHLYSAPDLLAEACRRLVREAQLSLRQTGALLGTTHHKVHEALQGSGESVL